jgi:hypothetical protein
MVVCEQLWLQQLRNWPGVLTSCLLLRWLLFVINGDYQQIIIGYFPPSKYHWPHVPLYVALVWLYPLYVEVLLQSLKDILLFAENTFL